jgi:succinoglycan biosynthesis protein ExoA
VPVLNEERYIAACLTTLLHDAAALDAEILVLDGGSTDRTPAIVAELGAAHRRIRLLQNPVRLQSAAVNLAARVAPGDLTVLVRADAHAAYPPGFIGTCLAALREHGATSVVVPMRTVGTTGMQRAIAALQNSWLGNGGSAHRAGRSSGFVAHGHHAAFDRAFFRRIGGYDETFAHNEDAEHDERSRRAGGRIWMCAEATITYFPRAALGELARQYFAHGTGRARTLVKHRMWPRSRQLAAPVVLAGSLGGIALAPLSAWCAAAPLTYGCACLAWGVVAAVRARDPWLLGIAPAAMTIHFAWAAGFYRALLRTAWERRDGPRAPPQAADDLGRQKAGGSAPYPAGAWRPQTPK